MDFGKEDIRKKMLGIRNSLTAEQVHEKSLAICRHMLQAVHMDEIGLVLLFAPVRNEPDMFLMHEIIKKEYPHISVSYPKVNTGNHRMDFYTVDDYKGELKPGYMNIPEPGADGAAGSLRKVDLSVLFDKKVLVAVPGLAFDVYGNRTGYGGGFYDRYLQPCRENGNIIKAAVCYGFQLCRGRISSSAHDVKMDYIITDGDALLIK